MSLSYVRTFAMLLACLFAVAMFAPSAAYAESNTKSIPGVAHGWRFNEFLDKPLPAEVSIYVDGNGNAYLRTDSIMTARGLLWRDEVAAFEAALTKAIEWSEVARTNSAEVEKDLGKWFKTAEFDQKHGVALTFRATANGTTSHVILTIIDFDNSFNSDSVVLEMKHVRELLSLVSAVPQTVSSLQSEIKNRQLFK